jgi:hypothetical protein
MAQPPPDNRPLRSTGEETAPSPGLIPAPQRRTPRPGKGLKVLPFRRLFELSSHFLRFRRKGKGAVPAFEAPLPPVSTYSGLDSLRPYVGSTPQIRLGADDWDEVEKATSTSERQFRGFVWGVVVASFVFVFATLYSHRVPRAREASSPAAPVHFDADAITARAETAEPLIHRASHGENDALALLKKKAPTERTPAEVAAIVRGEEVRAQAHAERTVRALAKQASFSSADRDEFLRHAGSSRTYREALLSMAESETTAGLDLLYKTMRAFRHQPEIAEFARALLVTPALKSRASPALRVIIDAETLSECGDIRKLLGRVAEAGDARSIRHMAKFAKTTGCGEHGIHDCYSCLRGDRELVDALRAAQARPAPEL